jgi:hypothetical protein
MSRRTLWLAWPEGKKKKLALLTWLEQSVILNQSHFGGAL